MSRLLYLALASVLLGGILHIGTILLLPALASRNIVPSFSAFGETGGFHLVPTGVSARKGLPLPDPQMALAACAFSLADKAAHIKAALPRGFWSVSVYGPDGRNRFSLNDRSAGRGDLDLVLASSEQIAKLRVNPPATLEQAIVTELPEVTGVVVLRALVGDESRRPEVEAALAGAVCAAPV